MVCSLLAVMAAVAAFMADTALAGHAAWESKLNYANTIVAVPGGAESLVASFANNATWAEQRRKRFVGVSHGTGQADTQLWPGKTIRYCFKDAATKQTLFRDLEEARDKWIRVGLPDDFKLVEVSDAECQSNRENVLLISYSPPGTGEGQSVMATTPALPPIRGGYVGPSMTLTDDETMGLLDRVSNYAHELGHAWGLYHEHQNPYFWDRTIVGGQGSGPFGAGNFNCQNLKDYAAVQQKITDKINAEPNGLGDVVYGPDRQKVCTSRAVAKQYKFSAYDYLPIGIDDVTVETHDPAQMDLTSIMLYPSGAGGTGNAQAGGPDNRNPILLQANGAQLPINLEPSPQDVAGLVALYGEQESPDPPLLSDKKNSRRQKFVDLFRKTRKDGQTC